MPNKSIYLMGIVKENKNKTLYVDTNEGRVFLGKTSGFNKGQEIMGEAVCSPRTVDYPAVAAVGTVGQPGYVAAQVARTDNAWSVENFYTDEMLTKKSEYETRRARATFETAKINKATTALAGITVTTTAEVFSLVA